MSRSLLTVAVLAGLFVSATANGYSVPVPPGPVVSVQYKVAQADSERVSMDEAVSKVRNRYGDVTILKTQTRRRNGTSIHQIKFLTESGKVRTVRVDANTGEFL